MVTEEEFKRRMAETPPIEYFELVKHGEGLYGSWAKLAFQKPPKDILGRILWSFGIIGQLIVSIFTFPAALGAFLLEEAVQSYGMGAYMLSTAKAYDMLSTYLDGYKNFIDAAETGAKTLATLSPITGGAVLTYMHAAKKQADAFEWANDKRLLEQAEKDEALRQKLLDEATYGQLRLSSTPSQAEIWINDVNTELLTPETFKDMLAGSYDITLRKYSATREVWDIFSFTIELEAGRKKEIHVRIPPAVTSEEEEAAKEEYGVLRIISVPTNAEIYLDGVDTGLLTTETFKEMTPGSHEIKLRAWSRTLALWDEYTFSVTVEKGKKLELKVNIPGKAFDKIVEGLQTDTDEVPQLGEFVKAEVTGEYAIDGDTFITTTGERIRVLAIDAPEIGRPWSEESREALTILVEDKKILLRIQSHKPLDTHGRTLAICSSWKGDIAVFQLSSGLARVLYFDDDIFDYTKYYAAEQIAKDRKIGIWS